MEGGEDRNLVFNRGGRGGGEDVVAGNWDFSLSNVILFWIYSIF
jgi:hypothetical protein